jgi:hypothetical protein
VDCADKEKLDDGLGESHIIQFGSLAARGKDSGSTSNHWPIGQHTAVRLKVEENQLVDVFRADPVGTEFRALRKEQSLGLPVREAIMNFVDRLPLGDGRFLFIAILLQKESGGNLVPILDKTSAVLRERARLRGQLRIYTAQGRITGWILCAAPFMMWF